MNSLLLNVICAFAIANTSPNAERAQQTLDALYKNYAAPNTCLLRENYPSDQNNKATYLASEEQAKRHNEYSYLWPYSGTFSAVNALETKNTRNFWKIKYYPDWKNTSTHEENHSLTHPISVINLSLIAFMMTTFG